MRLLSDAVSVWAPNYPRKVNKHQSWEQGIHGTVKALASAEQDEDNEPFISVYSFPNGHTSDGGIPKVDTLFIDFDIEDGDYKRGSGNEDAWLRDMSHLLVRVRKVARYISEHGRDGWRAALSGHKGIHLYIDFEPIDTSVGDYGQFVTGLGEYANELIETLEDATGIELQEYVDVTSSDLGRLCRVPNTIHSGASASFGEERYCVPVSIAELSEMSPDLYRALTKKPRPVPWESRTENTDVSEQISKRVATAKKSLSSQSSRSPSYKDESLVPQYKEEVANDDITLDDVKFLTSDRPCVWAFYERDDKWDYGVQSHNMEMYCIRELQWHNVPIDVMKQFFDSAPGYDEEYTERRIKEVISRDYNRFRTDTMLQLAPEFMASDGCQRCKEIIEKQELTI